MKTIALFFFLLPMLAAAQDVTFDTTYLSQQNGVYYVVQRVEFDNGEYEEKARQLGDSTTTATFLTTSAANEQQALTSAAMVYIRRNEINVRYNLLDGLYTSLTGVAFFRGMNRVFFPQYEGAWRIRYNGQKTDVVAELQASGNARLKRLSDNTTWAIRLKSPKNFTLQSWEGQNWEMYSEDGKVFYDINKTLTLRKL
jgi:hypothetical protein